MLTTCTLNVNSNTEWRNFTYYWCLWPFSFKRISEMAYEVFIFIGHAGPMWSLWFDSYTGLLWISLGIWNESPRLHSTKAHWSSGSAYCEVCDSIPTLAYCEFLWAYEMNLRGCTQPRHTGPVGVHIVTSVIRFLHWPIVNFFGHKKWIFEAPLNEGVN